MPSNLTGVLCVLILFYGSVYGKKHSDLTNLINNLTSNYNKYARPTFNLDNPTVVQVGFSLVIIKEFEEKTSKFSIGGSLIMTWSDFQMAWNPADYGGITTFLIPQTEVWKPEIVISNSYTSIIPLGHDRLDIRAHHYGFMIWAPFDMYDTLCAADVTYYPFDTHSCLIGFQPWLYYPNQELTITNLSSSVDLDYYFENGLWELVSADSSITITDVYQSYDLKITFKRRAMFHVVNILVPISIMGLLNVLVFVLPAESGERVGFTITVLLAMAVYLTIVSDNLPNSSQPSIPIICYILVADLLIGSFITLCTIISLRFYHKAEDQIIPSWLQCITCGILSKKQKKEGLQVRSTHTEYSDNEKSGASSFEPISEISDGLIVDRGHAGKSSHQIQSTKSRNRNTDDSRQSERQVMNEELGEFRSSMERTKWVEFAVFFDVVFGIFSLLLVIAKDVVTIIIFSRVW